jgi:predicted CoA-substrate-specific enzyme activase
MTKAVIYEEGIVAFVIGRTGAEHRRLANKVMEEVLAKAHLAFENIDYVLATGYGRINVPFADKQITEISCHARGVQSLFPKARTVIDIGGQDSKGIKIANGKVVDFIMNDKCAAGTGRFLEVIADALGVELTEMGELSLRSQHKLAISNICTIFAEQEVISCLSEGKKIEDIIAGLHESIASRICAMVERIRIEKDVVVTGGGAKNIGLVKAIENRLGFPVFTPPEPLLTGALGAALLAKSLLEDARNKGLTLPRKERRLEGATFFTREAV